MVYYFYIMFLFFIQSPATAENEGDAVVEMEKIEEKKEEEETPAEVKAAE